MAFSLIKLYPKSSFHIGEKGIGLEETSTIIHSDTLFSAICNAFGLLYGKDELEQMLKTFDNNPPFLISSAFYFVDNTLVFPLPLSVKLTGDFDTLKKLKNVRFISEKIFREVIENETAIKDYITKDMKILQGILFSSDEIIQSERIYRIIETPRVVLDRKTRASGIYHIAEVSFSEGCGYYFLIDYKNKTIKPKIEASIRLLGDEGIGGERTSGKGLFNPRFETIQFKNSSNERKNVTLSLVYPEKEEMSSIRNGSYELLTRGGWIFSQKHKNLRRRTVRMLSEGSVFSGKVIGKLVNVTPNIKMEHEIYRYGYAFKVPCG